MPNIWHSRDKRQPKRQCFSYGINRATQECDPMLAAAYTADREDNSLAVLFYLPVCPKRINSGVWGSAPRSFPLYYCPQANSLSMCSKGV